MKYICHFEIPSDNIERSKEFYGKLFDWKFGDMPGEEPYSIIESSRDGINGGLMRRQFPEHRWTNYVIVRSIDESIEKARSLGVKVVLDKTAVGGMGYMAWITDTENNIVGLWETDESAS